MEKVIIELENWDYECGDRCCYDSGTTIKVNGELSDNQYLGDDIEVLRFAFKVLGINYDVIIKDCEDA